MMDRLTLGATPAEEKCAQLGITPNYYEAALLECQVYRRQLIRMYCAAHGVDGLPPNCRLSISNNHVDAGVYHEVEVCYDDQFITAHEAAYWFDANTPSHWDDEAKKELQELNFSAA